ncbi:inactive leucine-rich repeat receptor-like protein kinase CORYNE isoform X2 [Vigna radiata var. radiata]|uniref:Inactive leucine-rich repeat receptor-like protein kinase CORYNE isoform X2 n=1 Tax=Vigna radiata var. radiata TaxID=3916 RepID=A0A1S3TWY8_VIGRR|nr:inactive leucine-rich repeat receptor-like protein kinase CORYNE isoform X2 [Vigna radiata var. radiata]
MIHASFWSFRDWFLALFVCCSLMFRKRNIASSLARELLALQPLFIIFLFSLHHNTVQCQGRLSKHVSSEPPSPSRPSPPSSSGYRDDPKKIILSLVLGAVTGLVCSVFFALVVRCVVQYLNRTPILKGPVIFSPKIAPKTLQLALAKENHLLGSSPNGKYYKTVLDNGLTIAVKRLTPFGSSSPEAKKKSVKRQIQTELELLASLRHRNLMSLRAYVREPDGFSLVYDYVSTGSLADVMNRVWENELAFGWEVRLRIAVGVVKGLQYLHFTCAPQILLHYNLKPTNVMLDGDFEPRLADYGLAKLLPNLDRGTSLYTPPECFHNCRYTDKSDIFSFGMILGVLLTGKDPTDPFFGEAASGGSLGGWLRHLQQAGDARDALDKSMLGEEGEEDEMLMAVRIAAACLSDMPADRPSSDELVHMLTQLHSF